MKKHILNLALTLSVTIGSFGIQSNKAQAMVITTGGLSTAAFVVVALTFTPAYLQHASGNPTRLTEILYGIAFGAFILDKDSNNLSFKPVKNGSQYGLTDSETEAFNSEINRINGAVQEAILSSSDKVDTDKILSDISQEISAEAFSALRKICDQSMKQASK